MRGALNAQRVSVLVQCFNHAVSQRTYGFTVFNGTLDDFVVNIGNVAHVSNGQAPRFQPTLHDIKSHHSACMAQMAQVVHRHTAHIHARMAGNQGGKIFYCT